MTKAQRIDRVKNTLDEETLVDRLPEVELIIDDEIREGTKLAFLDGCPDYFWERPSSSTGKYHLEDERGKMGNWLHTKRVFTTYLVVSRTFLELGQISDWERECGKSAALLHDMLKFGWPSDRESHTVNDHDIIGSDVAAYIGKLPDEVCRLVDRHNGPWAEGGTPRSANELAFHLSDYVAAKRILGTPHVVEPHDNLVTAFDPPALSDDEIEGLL